MTRRTLRRYSRPGEAAERYKAWECCGRHKGRSGNGCKMRVVREKEVLDAIEKAIGREADEDSIELIDRVMITEDEIVVERA